jgi:methylmalonyl-CoA mutase C-terminal domain/subunit
MSRARITIGIMGVDQHENGAIAVSRYLREAQMDVRYAGLFLTPEKLLARALEDDADVIGISCHSWEFLHYMPELMARLETAERQIPVVVGGSVLTPGDKAQLMEMGVAACFSAGAQPDDIADEMRRLAQPRVAARLSAAK